MKKERLTFILSQTRFASNLGSAARVLKNFGFSRLFLINPQCQVGAEARTFSMKGAELLDNALVLPDLEAARTQVDMLVGTSARSMRGGPRLILLDRLLPEVLAPYRERRIGIVFGSEKNGLTTAELSQCDFCTAIPTDSSYQSLNLAQAVAVVAYHVQNALSAEKNEAPPPAGPSLPDAHWENFLQRLNAFIAQLPLPEEMSRARILKRLTLLAARARPEKHDLDLLQGLFKRIQNPKS